MPSSPQPGQKTISIKDWQRFLKVADWYDRTIGHKPPGALSPTYGRSLMVKTPAGGIPGRDGDTIYSATCFKCVEAETATAGEKTIHETTEQLLVWNIYAADVPGEEYVVTGLTTSGTRYAELDHVRRWGKLDDELLPGGTQVVSLWQETGGGWGGWDEDSLEDWTCYAPPLLSSGSIASGKWVFVGIVNGRRVVLLPEC